MEKNELNCRESEKLLWKKVATKHLVQNQWIDFREETYELPDGEQWSPFYTYSRRDFVIIVARDVKGRFICVRQYRQGVDKITTEFPAGGLEPGEDTLLCAKRELLEETGYKSDSWKKLLHIPSNATISDNYMTIYFADGCERAGSQNLDETEFVDVTLLSVEEIQEMIDKGEFLQAAHVLGFLMAMQKAEP